MKFYLIFILLIFNFVNCHENISNDKKGEDSAITKFMKYLEVIPDVISEGPTEFLSVLFDSGVQGDKGVELKLNQVKNQPKIEWKADKNSFYTLIMTDPDAPSRKEPKFKEWIHWTVGNIPGNDIEKGDILFKFARSAPPKNSGLHRYVFLVYKQPDGKIEFDEQLKNTETKDRSKFSTQNFIKKYKFKAPVAGNFYQTQYEENQ